MSLSRCHDEYVGLLLLHDEIYRVHEFGRPSPVAFGVEVTENERVLHPVLYPRDRLRYLFRDERTSAPRALMVEEYSRSREHAVAVAVLLCQVVRRQLRDAVGTLRIHRRLLPVRRPATPPPPPPPPRGLLGSLFSSD